MRAEIVLRGDTQVPRRARSTRRLRETVLDAVITSGRAVSETAAAFGISWWLVQQVIGDAALRLPDVDLLALRMLGIDERRYRSVRFFQDPGTKAWTRYEPWMTTIVHLDTGHVQSPEPGEEKGLPKSGGSPHPLQPGPGRNRRRHAQCRQRPLWAAEAALDQAEAAHKKIPLRVPLGELSPGQQVLETEVKLLTHAIRMAAFNTATTLAREIRTNTGYARASEEAHALVRQALTSSGDIDTTKPGYLIIRLDPLPTARATAAIGKLCQHLATTETQFPDTGLILCYEIKNPT